MSKHILTALALSLLLAGCHEDDDDNNDTPDNSAQVCNRSSDEYRIGYFIDGPVEGLRYRVRSGSPRSTQFESSTQADGAFCYPRGAGSDITFYLGDRYEEEDGIRIVVAEMNISSQESNLGALLATPYLHASPNDIAAALQSLEENNARDDRTIIIPGDVHDRLGDSTRFAGGTQELSLARLNDFLDDENLDQVNANQAAPILRQNLRCQLAGIFSDGENPDNPDRVLVLPVPALPAAAAANSGTLTFGPANFTVAAGGGTLDGDWSFNRNAETLSGNLITLTRAFVRNPTIPDYTYVNVLPSSPTYAVDIAVNGNDVTGTAYETAAGDTGPKALSGSITGISGGVATIVLTVEEVEHTLASINLCPTK